MQIEKLINELLTEGFSLSTQARKIGCDRSTVVRIRTGQIKQPNAELLARLIAFHARHCMH